MKKASSPDQLGFDLGGEKPAKAPPRPPDWPARDRIATELETNFLVEAGAGSGKTTALVSRMVALVRTGTAPVHQIAAVTFTRKAAGELRERFQEALEKERLSPRLTPEERARVDAAIREMDRAFMGTIHAFCARLLRERPLEARVDPSFVETTPVEAHLLAHRFWSLHLERLAADGDAILGELEDVGLSPDDLRSMYDRLREYTDVEFPLEATPPPDPATVAKVRAELNAILDAALPLIPREEPANQWDDLQRRLRSVGYVRRYSRRWHDDRVLLDALADLCSRKEWKVTQYKWTPTGGGRSPAAKAICERVNQLNAAGAAARTLIEQWWAHRYPVAMRFALGAARALQHHRRETGQLDFQDLLAISAELLRTHESARRDLGMRWRRILVDEFQDTDPLQAEVLFLLASEPDEPGAGAWTGAIPRPGGLFVVGDPKQSIYRFRRADIALYMRVRERFRGFGAVLGLIANFRSGQPIADLVNSVFAPPDGFPWEADAKQAAFAPLEPQPKARPPLREGVFHYVVNAPDDNQKALTAWGAEALADWIAQRIREGRKYGDFLVLTRAKAPLARYAAALEARNLPVQVSGAGVSVDEEVAELRLLLEALTDPDDPSKTVAALIGLFFGFDHEQLLAHTLAERRFDFRHARAGTGDPVEDALVQLRQWANQARIQPADVVVASIAEELGLLPYAASGELGGVRAGALAFALDAVRGAGLRGDTSLTGALEALEAALLEDEAEAPLEPGRTDVIRLMNLHKAKGLEAKVVVLADPSIGREHPIEHHIERTDEGRARGWFCVVRKDERKTRMLARPAGWAEKERAEREFDRAEDFRVLYVAATRAEEELLVARHPTKPTESPWHAYDGWLDQHGVKLELTPTPPPARERLDKSAAVMAEDIAAATRARDTARIASYRFSTVTGLVKGEAREQAPSEEEALPPLRSTSSGPGGYEWGSAVHAVLEAAARGATHERLRALGRSLLLELDRPTRAGEPTELESLLATVKTVQASALWRRATSAPRRIAEVPFALELAEGRYLEGVVDLAFHEPDGWVLADYKTDRGDDPDFATRRIAYRKQLRHYGAAWSRLTGQPVTERVILWVRSGEEERVDA